MRVIFPLAAALIVFAGGCAEEQPDRDPVRQVRVALDFQPNAVHAGLYEAAAPAVAKRRRVALRLVVPGGSTNSLRLLASRRVDVAVADIHDLGLARERGQDLVGVGALVQRPLAAVIARDEVKRPRDLEGRRVGVTGLPSDDAVLRAVVEHDGGNFRRVRRITIGFSAVPALVTKRVAAVTAFWNAEGVTLRQRGVATREFRVENYGAPRYPELVLVVRRPWLRKHRALIENLLAAIREGTGRALGDAAAATRRVVRAGGGDPALVREQFEAVGPALAPPVRLDQGALEEWARFDERFGILRRAPDVGRAFDTTLAASR